MRLSSAGTPESTQLDMVVVDDDSLTLEIVGWLLRNTPIKYRLFDSPVEAMQHLSDDMPRLLIVDFYMPGINGIDLLYQLDAVNPLAGRQVYLCSAVAPESRHTDRLRDLSGVKLMSKADLCDGVTLMETINHACGLTGKATGGIQHIGPPVALSQSGVRRF